MEWQDPSKAQASRAHMTRSRPMGGSVAPQGSSPPPPLPQTSGATLGKSASLILARTKSKVSTRSARPAGPSRL